MICEKYKVIFIHIPKTGGISLNHMFDMFEYTGKIMKYKSIDGMHLNACQIKDRFPQHFKDFFKFTVIRNPWSRLYSAYIVYYNNILRAKKERPSFDYWLYKVIRKKRITSQFQMISIDGKIVVDHIMRFENLNQEWKELCKKINKPFEPMVRKNYYKYKPITLQEAYKQKNIDYVAEMYKKDIEYFNYDFPN